jgi:hypothetical protein
MPVITGEWEIEGEKLRVWSCHYLTDDPGDSPRAFRVKHIPDYPPPVRVMNTLCFIIPKPMSSILRWTNVLLMSRKDMRR